MNKYQIKQKKWQEKWIYKVNHPWLYNKYRKALIDRKIKGINKNLNLLTKEICNLSDTIIETVVEIGDIVTELIKNN